MSSEWRNSLRNSLVALDLKSSGKWFVLSTLIGIVAGVGAITFQVASQSVLHFTLAQIAGYTPREPAGEHTVFQHQERTLSPWLIVAVMAGGGLVSGVIVYTFAPEAEGHGTDAAIESFHNHVADDWVRGIWRCVWAINGHWRMRRWCGRYIVS